MDGIKMLKKCKKIQARQNQQICMTGHEALCKFQIGEHVLHIYNTRPFAS